MNYKKKKDKKIYLFLIIIVLFIFGLFINKNIYNFSKDILEKSRVVLIKPFKFIDKKIKSINKCDKLLEKDLDNTLLLDKLDLTLEQNDLLKKDILELKDNLNLNKIYSSYDLIYASVIKRDVLYWFNTITIDKGIKDGVKVGNAVVTSKGLIGQVLKTTNNTSTIKLITSKDSLNKISVAVKGINGYSHGVISDYKDNLLVVEGITNYDGVSLNSKVLTTGYGVFPRGLLVGYVKDIKKDNYDISKVLYVQLNQDINDLFYVVVLKD